MLFRKWIRVEYLRLLNMSHDFPGHSTSSGSAERNICNSSSTSHPDITVNILGQTIYSGQITQQFIQDKLPNDSFRTIKSIIHSGQFMQWFIQVKFHNGSFGTNHSMLQSGQITQQFNRDKSTNDSFGTITQQFIRDNSRNDSEREIITSLRWQP